MILSSRRFILFVCLWSGCLSLVGCFSLDPVVDPAHFFVLSASLDSPAVANVKTNQLGLGIGPVSLANYLQDNRLAVRRLDHEIVYADDRLWAERLSKSLPRILAVNMARLLGTDRIQTGSWSRQDVAFELHLTMHRFEWNESGQATLEAQWFLRRPGAETMSASGFTQLMGSGPSLYDDPEGAVATLNDLLLRMSRQIASKLEVLQETP